MANSSKPRYNLRAKTPAIFGERDSLQMQRRHMPVPPETSPRLLPVHKQCRNPVTRSPTILSDTNSEDRPKTILKQSLRAPTYAGSSRNKSLSTTSEKLLVLKPESTSDTISYSSYLGTQAFRRRRFPQGVLCWPESQQMRQPAGISSLCWVQTGLSKLKALYAIMHLPGHSALN